MVYNYVNEKILQGLETLTELDKKAHQTWCNENQISFTPTFFIAGYQLPDLYKVEDLQYFIGEMVEEIAVSC